MQRGGCRESKIRNWWISSAAAAGYYHWLSSNRRVRKLILKHCTAALTTFLPTLVCQNVSCHNPSLHEGNFCNRENLNDLFISSFSGVFKCVFWAVKCAQHPSLMRVEEKNYCSSFYFIFINFFIKLILLNYKNFISFTNDYVHLWNKCRSRDRNIVL